MTGKSAASFMLSLVGAVLILTGVSILAFIGHYLSLYSSEYYRWGVTLVPFFTMFIFRFIGPVLAIVILIGAFLTSLKNEKRAEAGSAIVLAFSTIISLFLLPKVLAYYGRFTDIINARDLGVSGLIDFLGGFVPSAIGTAGVILCIIGGILGLWGKPSPPSPSLSKVQVSETEETMICPECGAINNARYKFCFKCGARLKPVKPRKTEEAVKVEQAACPVCGKTLPGDSRFCSQCGTPLSRGEQLPPPPPDIESRLEKLEERIAKLERSEGKTEQQIEEEKSKEESEAGESIFKE